MTDIVPVEYTDPHEPWAREVEKMLGLKVGEDTNHSRSVTDEPYVTISAHGIKDEGSIVLLWGATEDAAREAFMAAVGKYAASIPGRKKEKVLYWRTTPEMGVRTVLEKQYHQGPTAWEEVEFYAVYARLLVSTKTVIARAA